MARIVFVLFALAAITGCMAGDDSHSVSSSEEDRRPTVFKSNTPAVGLSNPKTEACPNGVRFMNECNWCTCVPSAAGGMCTAMGCVRWSCERQLDRLAANENCYGHCTCNSVTKITSCERKGC